MRKIRAALIVIIFFILIGIFPAFIEAEETSFLPLYFSWRDINGIDYTTPIKNQAPAPTCEAYALVAALETKMQYKLGNIYNPDLSEAHLFFYPGGSVKAGYVNIIDAANYLVEYGVPDEGCFPDPHRPYDFSFESLPGWENRTVKIKEWGWVEHTQEAMKKALIEYGPLVVCMYFWKDFYYYHGGIYRHRWGRLAGGHVMAIVGYNDSQHCWIIKNSWGIDWGENGWLRIDYNALRIAEWYGKGTGVMYIGEVYGNLEPDVPKIRIEQPEIYHTYIFGESFRTLFRRLPLIQEGASRIIGPIYVKVEAMNTNRIEFYLDGELKYVDEQQPYEWLLKAKPGLHTIEVLAYDEDGDISKDVVDVFVFL